MLVVLSEQTSRTTSVNAQEIKQITEIARMFGCRIFTIPQYSDKSQSEDTFSYVPEFTTLIPAIWVGFIPTAQHYQTIYRLALKKNIQLINSPEQHNIAMEFDKFYPMLADITPKSVTITSISQFEQAMNDLKFPVFVKGAVKSNKDRGWDAVTADNFDKLKVIVESSFKNAHRTRGKVIIRELAKLKSIATDPNGFPIGREYRAFVYQHEMLDYGFYWDEYDDPNPLSKEDEKAMKLLIHKSSQRVDVPFISIDVAQLQMGDWIVIEIGDGQFSGLSQISPLKLWQKLSQISL